PGALEPLVRAVALRRLARDLEREPRFERRRRRERDSPELRACDHCRIGRVLADACGDALAECAQEVGPRLEAVLVEVVARAFAAAQQEVPLEVRVLLQRALQLLVGHAGARSA